MLSPTLLIPALAAVVCVRFWQVQRQQAEAQRTVRELLETQAELTPELLRALGVRPASSDLRRGVMLMAVAAGCALFGLIDAVEDGGDGSLLTFLAIAAFPALIGAAFIGFHVTDRSGR